MKVLDQHSVRAEQPSSQVSLGSPPIGVQLRPHQLALLARCRELERGTLELQNMPEVPRGTVTTMQTRVGIIGDRAGAGKSYVILALIRGEATAEESGGVRGEEEGGGSAPTLVVCSLAGNRVVLTTREEDHATTNLTVLVIPHNLCGQWSGYVATFGGGLATASVSRSRHVPALAQEGALDGLDLIVVTSTFYNDVASLLRGRRIRRLIFDEADSVGIPNCHEIKAGFNWFATASYRNLLHPHGEGTMMSDAGTGYRTFRRTTAGLSSSGFVRTLFSDLCGTATSRAATEALVVRNDDAFIDASIRIPDPIVEIVPCRTPHAIRVLTGYVDRTIMQFLNAGDVESAIQHIDPNNRRSEENVVAVLMGRLEREAQNYDVRLTAAVSLNFASEEARTAEVVRLTARRDDIRNRMAGIQERVKGCDTCCICYEEISNKTVVPCCSNSFCFGCISRWIAQRNATHALCSCPLCKARLSVGDLLVVSSASASAPESAEEKENADASSSSSGTPTPPFLDKLGSLEAILRDRCATPGRSKVLVFSSFDNTFNDITRVLQSTGIRWRYLKGNHAVIAKIEREYRGGELDVLLVNTNHYGSGLNFENTTDVIMWHKFDTDIEHQVIGRAQRSGRTDPLKIWYLKYETETTSSGGGDPPLLPRASAAPSRYS